VPLPLPGLLFSPALARLIVFFLLPENVLQQGPKGFGEGKKETKGKGKGTGKGRG
jgi:hypothetical protein